MIKEFKPVAHGLTGLLNKWENKLTALPNHVIADKRNSQNRTIKQILGHMIDSVSNNTHRVVHLQYRESPLQFPNYATNGNNDRWIAIQNYQDEDWTQMVQLWKYAHLHYVHIIGNVNPEKLENEWISESKYGNIALKDMIVDFLRHFELHLGEIDELINRE
ncbi:DinB family protein [Bacteroidota bacterium]